MKKEKVNSVNTIKGQVLLMNYNDSSFIETAEKKLGSGIMDIRESGFSNDPTKTAEALKAKFGARYMHEDKYAIVFGDDENVIMDKIANLVSKIVEITDKGVGVILIHNDTALLKLIGHFLSITATITWMRWTQNEKPRESRQRVLSAEDEEIRLKKLVESYNKTHEDGNKEVAANFAAFFEVK